MAIISSFSEIYAIISGKHAGRTCVIRELGKSPYGLTQIIFADNNKDKRTTVRTGELALLELPGWPGKIYFNTYGLKKHFESKDGSGECMLRTSDIAQPQALKPNDELATGEIVIDIPRRGYNSSCLICLSRTGWVELAPRLPIALKGNKKFKLPIELKKDEKLATGCLIVEKPDVPDLNWVNVYLDRKNCCIEVPSCIPLALA